MHKLYLQESLPYLSVKRCPVCNTLVDVGANVCSNCTYSFVKIVKKETTNTNVGPKNESINKQPTENINNISNQQVASSNDTNSINNDEYKNIEDYSKENNITLDENKKPVEENKKPIIEENVKPQVTETNTNVETSDEDVNQQVVPAIEIETNKKEKKPKKEKVKKEKVKKPKFEESVELENVVNVGRKRLFLIIQLVVVSLLLLIAILTPILSNDSFFKAIVSGFGGKSNDTIMAGKDFFKIIFSNKFDDIEFLRPFVTTQNNLFMFADIPFIKTVLSFLGNGDSAYIYGGITVGILTFSLIFISTLIIYITSIFGFIKRTPLRSSALGFQVWSYLIGCILIYSNRFFEGFESCDSWLILGFGVTFLLWFVIKIVLGKESRIYKRQKIKEETEFYFNNIKS